jgi:protein transport protein SEC31
MKLLEADRSATVAWSPLSGHQAPLLASGTVAGTFSEDFDTSANLEIFSVDLFSNKKELKVLGQTKANDRFHKLCWGMSPQGMGSTFPSGILAAGLANGFLNIWDPAKIIA